MPQIDRKDYTTEERRRYGAAYKRLEGMVYSTAPDTEEFSQALDEALAEGFPVDWPGGNGWALLHKAVFYNAPIRASLPKLLIDAGADINVPNDYDHTPLGLACWNYSAEGAPEYLQAVETLLAAGARLELDSRWESKDWKNPEQQARRDWLETYIKTWQARARADDAAPAFDYSL